MSASARFKVDSCFVLNNSRKLFVLAGEVVDGKVSAGMKIRLGADADSETMGIAQLELLTYADRRRDAGVAICLRYASEDQLASLRALNLARMTLLVVD